MYGHKHPDAVAASYNNSALIYEDQGLYEKSLVHDKALEIDITVSGQECLSPWGRDAREGEIKGGGRREDILRKPTPHPFLFFQFQV